MLEDYKRETLYAAMEAAGGVSELPRRYDDGSGEIWIRAIVLVKKLNCTQNYALASRRGDGLISVTQDFGYVSPITGIVSVHPYLYLDAKRYLWYEGNEDEERREFSRSFGWKGLEYDSVSAERRHALFVDKAIESQLRETCYVADVDEALEAAASEIAADGTETFEDVELPQSNGGKKVARQGGGRQGSKKSASGKKK